MFETIRKLYKNRLQRFSMCATVSEEAALTEEEIILGSKQKAQELGIRFRHFENDESFLEDALTFGFIHRKLLVKANYSFEEVVKIVREAMGERNRFLRECWNSTPDSVRQAVQKIVETDAP